jgi:Fe(3+) dicitrate transport protein
VLISTAHFARALSFFSILVALASPTLAQDANPRPAAEPEVVIDPSATITDVPEAQTTGVAADPNAAPAEEIQVLVIGTPLARTPGSAHVVRSSQLERFKRDDPHAVLTTVPGVYVRGEDGFGLRPNIGIRGVNPDRSKKVSLLEDGVLFGPAPYSAPAAYYFPLVTRMTQVRVIKGPGAIAYGPQTIGGAIDFITRPIPDSTTGGFDLAGGQYGYTKAHGFAGTSDGQVGFLVEGLHLSTDGFKELPGAEDTGFYRNDWMVKGSYVIDPEAEIRNELKIKLTYSDELSNETYLGISDDEFDADPLQRYPVSLLDRMRNHRTSLVATHVLDPSDDVKVTTNVYRHDYYRIWRKANRFRGTDADGEQLFDVIVNPRNNPVNDVYLNVLRGLEDSTGSAQDLMIGPNEREYVSQGVETRARIDAETGVIAHRIELGARFHNDRIDRRHSEDPYQVIGGELYPNGPTEVTTVNEAWTYALAGHVADAMTWQSLTLTPGLRVEAMRSSQTNLDPAATDYNDDNARWSHALLPGLGVYYGITEQLGVLGGVYRGYSPIAPGSDDDVDPELSWNYEAGARYTRGPARAELIGFYNDYQNLTDTCTFSSGCADRDLDKQFDAGEARIYGFEAYLDYEVPLPAKLKLPLTAAYTFTLAEFLSTFESSDPLFGDVEHGDEMPYVPEHQLSASLGLEHERAGGSVSATYVSSMLEQDDSMTGDLRTDEQLIFDLALYLRASEPIELYALARNLFDSDFIVSRRPYGARPNAPLMVSVGVKVNM